VTFGKDGNVKTFEALWGTALVVTSLLATLICFVVAILMLWRGPGWINWIAVVLLATICGGALFTIRRFTVTPDAILVHRLFWKTRLPLGGLQSAEFAPGAMRWSLRMFGNGGLFSFSGFFRNKTLGVYRAFVTDLRRTVVLRFPTRTVVVPPSAPEDFVRDLTATRHGNMKTKDSHGHPESRRRRRILRWATDHTKHPARFASWREVPRFARDDRAQGSITR
jgi:hypothetical protein